MDFKTTLARTKIAYDTYYLGFNKHMFMIHKFQIGYRMYDWMVKDINSLHQ